LTSHFQEWKTSLLNTQREKRALIKLKGSSITPELRRITLTKIDEIKLIFSE